MTPVTDLVRRTMHDAACARLNVLARIDAALVTGSFDLYRLPGDLWRSSWARAEDSPEGRRLVSVRLRCAD